LSLDPERQAILRQTFADLNGKEHPYRAIAVFDKLPVALVEIEDDVLSPLRVLNL
jgi:enamine deaminase RidA (YjgF/YER057c/UK114 family)